MTLLNEAVKAGITSLVTVWGKGELFDRILNECRRVNATNPHATGAEKRHIVLLDLQIIFDDLVVPVGESVLRFLLEAAVVYIKLSL